MTDSPADLVRAHLEAFSTGDLPGLLATLAPDADFVSGTTRVGPAEFGDFFGWAMRELDPTMTVARLLTDGADVAVEFVESITADGERRHLNRAAFYRVADGLIETAKVYDERQE